MKTVQYILANGSMVIATEKEANFGLTALIMKGIGNDKACGKGRLFHADGDIFEGMFINNEANGLGVYTN